MTDNNVMFERRKLFHAFNELKSYRIIAVCAPAGYGKTIAVTQWLSKDARAKAFMSLDEYDNNLIGFCERLCASFRSFQPQNQTLNAIISHDSFQNAPCEFTLRAVAALSGRKRSVLAIDDLHLIHSYEVLKFLLVIIKRLPKNFQIILISRHELPMEFSDLWVKEQIAGLGVDKLLFSDDEVKALYNKRGKQITIEQAKNINQQTHGWAIGIRASLLSGGESFDKTSDYMGDFVRKNIWEKWDDKTRNFMLCTAFLQELTFSLCNAMAGISDSEKFLKGLENKGAFTVQMEKNVYRYHHLFQDFLKSMAYERNEEFVKSLFETEGRWHLEQMDFYSAADRFIQSKNHDGIAKCFDLLEVSERNNFLMERLLPILKHPETITASEKYPHLFYQMAYCAFAEGRADDMAVYMDGYYARYTEIVQRTPHLAHNIFYMRFFDFRVTLRQIIAEVEALPATESTAGLRGTASMHLPLLHRSSLDFSELAIGGVEENIAHVRHKVEWLFADEINMYVYTLLAGLLYEQGNIEKAHEYAIKANAEIKEHFMVDSKFCAMSILVYTLDATREANESDQIIDSISQMIEDFRAYHLNHNFYALIANRKFAIGNTTAATEWMKTCATDTAPSIKGLYTVFTTSRAYITVGKYDSAIVLLTKILQMVTVFKRPPDIIDAHILLAIAYWKKKGRFQNVALEHLDAAVSVAYPYDFVQMFINNGAEISGMMYKLQKSAEQRKEETNGRTGFIRKLYLKIRSDPNFKLTNEPKAASLKFTDRQRTIMRLLCQGKTHKEIAGVLGIKPPSVSTHIKLIYNKLDVTHITDAINRINSLGLFG